MSRTARTVFEVAVPPRGDEGPAQPAAPAARASSAGERPPPVERLIAGLYLRWLPLAGLWLSFAFLIAFGIIVNNTVRGGPASLPWALYATVPHFLAWALVSPALYRALYEVVDGARRGLALSMLAAWSIVALGVSTVFCYLGVALRERIPPTPAGLVEAFIAPPLGPAYQAMNLSILVCALAGLAVLLAFRQRARAQWTGQQGALHAARLEFRLAEARLQTLQARINPHFLFNSLNAIAGFVQSGRRDDAFDAVARLGALLRTALAHGESPHVSLGEELDFAERYMELLGMRFGAKFRYTMSVPEALRTRRVPALIVQPLIENAVHHGMLPQRALTVEVRAYSQGETTVIEVLDDGRGIEAEGSLPMRPGHGLANVAERLRLAFGEQGRLDIAARDPHGAAARLSFAA
jgi:signal transduction histidine kinase